MANKIILYTLKELDTPFAEDKHYINDLLAVGQKINEHHRTHHRVFNFDIEEDVKEYKIFEKERKNIENIGKQLYTEYVKYLSTRLSHGIITEEQAVNLWHYLAEQKADATIHKTATSFNEIITILSK